MAKLKIEAHDLGRDTPVNPATLEVKIFDGDELVAETTLESLVMKFLLVSGEHANAMAVLGMIEANHNKGNKIVIAKPGDVPKEQ
jgi:hypothetical protein